MSGVWHHGCCCVQDCEHCTETPRTVTVTFSDVLACCCSTLKLDLTNLNAEHELTQDFDEPCYWRATVELEEVYYSDACVTETSRVPVTCYLTAQKTGEWTWNIDAHVTTDNVTFDIFNGTALVEDEEEELLSNDCMTAATATNTYVVGECCDGAQENRRGYDGTATVQGV